jgi:hypothetical protein
VEEFAITVIHSARQASIEEKRQFVTFGILWDLSRCHLERGPIV